MVNHTGPGELVLIAEHMSPQGRALSPENMFILRCVTKGHMCVNA